MPRSVVKSQRAIAGHIEPAPTQLAELVPIMEEDYQIVLAKRVLSSNVKSAKVTVSPDDSEDERTKAVAEHLEQMYWAKLPTMLECVPYGRVAYEKEWAYREDLQATVIDAIHELPFSLSKMLLSDEGEYEGIEVGTGNKKVKLSVPYSWWLALDPEPLRPHGRSRYLGAVHRTWKYRRDALKLRDVFVRKFALGQRVAHAPEFEEIGGETVDVHASLCEAITNAEAGGTIILPDTRTMAADGSPGDYVYRIEELNTDVKDGRPILDVLDAMDAEQLLAFGIPPKTVIEGDAVGSFALVSQQMLLLLSVVEDIVSQVTESYQKYIVDKTVEWAGVQPIAVNFTPLTEKPDDLAIELARSWLTTPNLSPILKSGSVDIHAVLDSVGIPVKPDTMARIEKMLEANREAMQQVAALPVAKTAGDEEGEDEQDLAAAIESFRLGSRV